MTSVELDRAFSLIRLTQDFPQPGILFRDIAPLLADAQAFRATIDALIEPFAGQFDLVAGVEARGFVLAGAAAAIAGTGVLPIRKAGKTPQPAAQMTYDLEYGTATIEVGADIPAGARVLVVDDVLATGGTLHAAHGLVEQLGGIVAGTGVLLEIEGLGGRAALGEKPVHAVFA